MNKKILTLLAAGFMGSLSVSAFATAPVMTPQKLHQLATSTGVLSMVVDPAGQDSLSIESASTDVMSEAFKRSLWSIDSTNVDNNAQKVYTFTNYYTKKVLSMNLSKETAIIATPGQSAWLVGANGELTAIKNGVTYKVATHGSSELVACKDAGVTAESFTIAPVTVMVGGVPSSEVDLEVQQINGLYGTATSLVFDKAMQGNPLAGVPFTAVGASNAKKFNIRLTNGQYLVVDTTQWTNEVAAGNYWKVTTDAKPAMGTDRNADGSSVLPNGRTEKVYNFSMSLNVAEGYKITIMPEAVPILTNAADPDQGGSAALQNQKFCYGDSPRPAQSLKAAQFAGGAVVMYASANANRDNADVTAQFGVLSTPDALSKDYVYYVQDRNAWENNAGVWEPNADYNKYEYTIDQQAGARKYKGASSYEIPRYMWYLNRVTGVLENMSMTTENHVGQITLINEAEGIYAFGTDTLKLTKGPKLDDARKMAYRAVSAEDLINGALSFRLVSVLANDLYVVEKGSTTKTMYVNNSELADATKFKTLLSRTTTTEGNRLERPLYYLLDRAQKQVLTKTAAGYQWKSFTGDANVANVTAVNAPGVTAVEVSFYATGVENEYKIVYNDGGEKAITANAATGILEEKNRTDEALVRFQFAKKDAPMYGSPKFGHVQITTLEDDDKMIAPQMDGWAALKAEGQILKSDVYTNDSLKLWLDTAYVRKGVNYYYLASTAFTTFNKEDIKRNYLINPANRYAALNPADQAASGYLFTVKTNNGTSDTYRAAFEPAKRIGEAKDSLAIFEKDTLSASSEWFQPLNPAAVAFEVVVNEGDEVYNIVSKLAEKRPLGVGAGSYDPLTPAGSGNEPYDPATLSKEYYLAQLNNVLFWAEDQSLAEKFVINRTTAPTANEAVEAESGVEVIAGQGVVTVQGAAGKVITVANILGQTIANQVAASDNVTIAAPAGVVVVTVDGEVVKTIVK